MKDERIYLRHIAEAIQRAQKYANSKTFEEFAEDEMLQAALVRELEIVGEAASKLSEEYRKMHSQVPWRVIIVLRNKLIHDYFGVNLEMVWEILEIDLPPLKQQINELLT